MTTERETLRIIGSWMEDGRTRLPDHVLDAVLDQLPSTPQRRPAWSARRITHVNPLAKYAIVAAAVVVVAVAGLGLYSNQPGGGVGGQPSPSPSASPTAPPSPTATPRSAPENGLLGPGTYVFRPLAPRNDSLTVTFTVVVEGWQTFGTVLMPSGEPETGPPGGMAILFPGDVTTLNDPCNWLGTADDVRVGPTVDDLVEALRAQTAYEVSDPVDVTIGGYNGKRVDIDVPTEPFPGQNSSAPECDQGVFQLWSTAGWGEDGIYAQGPADRWHTNILDVDGTRLVIVTRDFAGTSAADRAEMDAIIDSVVIQP